MEPNTPAPIAPIADLFTLLLVDGLPLTSNGKPIKYQIVRLRETTVAHERTATRQAERIVLVGGVHKLLTSDADFRLALTVQHIEAFECDGVKIDAGLIDLDMVGRLSTHDFGLIEERVFLITLAAEVRYGLMTQAQFDALASGKAQSTAPASPQPVGQAAGVGAVAAAPESGPAMLTDYAGGAPAGAPAVVGH